MNKATIEEISSAVTETGGVVFTRNITSKYYDKALSVINKINIGKEKREKLIFIINKAYNSEVLPHS